MAMRRAKQDIDKALGLVLMRDLLSESRCWTAREMAQRLGVSQRTVQRWLAHMDALGVAVAEEGSGPLVRYHSLFAEVAR
ncbi:MAG: helix-turn-helix domain-containing protein [Gemmatimonadaceae bacterium]|nr:helix-turn-helix domain-containing protein [Gemmatimonadaceae bacterium]